MSQYILAHDLGTSGNKATLFSTDGTLTASTVHSYNTLTPHSKWVEQDPEDWWKAVCGSTKDLLEKSGVNPKDILGVCFSAQMMGCLVVDKNGDPLRNMIIWADTRSDKQEKWMLDQISLQKGYDITGHRLSASYSAAKLLWIKDNERANYDKAYKMLHAKDYIIYKLCGNFVTDYSDASSTNLLDLTKKDWSDELLDAFSIRKDLLPDLHPSTDVAGKITKSAAAACGLLEGTPVVIGGGDAGAACVGAGVVAEGKSYTVIGTSSWISFAAKKPLFDKEMRTFNWVHFDPNLYMPCGTMQAAGYSYQWYRNTLCGAEQLQAEQEKVNIYSILDKDAASSPAGAGSLLFLPYQLGERSPWWNHLARGCYIGLNASSTKADMTRAVLEGVAFNLKVILDIFNGMMTLEDIVMIGGGAKGKFWLQLMADIWQTRLQVPAFIEEATSVGAAICGGVGLGIYKDFASCANFNKTEQLLTPNPQTAKLYEKQYEVFKNAYHSLIPVFEDLAELDKLK